VIIEELRNIHRNYRLEKATVSQHTKSAQLVTKEWQKKVCHGPIEAEVRVSENNNEKIDVVDHETLTAYELKVSGKNPHHEFYKDIMKVLTFNEYQTPENRLMKFVFITEKDGIKSLEKRIDSKLINLIQTNHNVQIEMISL